MWNSGLAPLSATDLRAGRRVNAPARCGVPIDPRKANGYRCHDDDGGGDAVQSVVGGCSWKMRAVACQVVRQILRGMRVSAPEQRKLLRSNGPTMQRGLPEGRGGAGYPNDTKPLEKIPLTRSQQVSNTRGHEALGVLSGKKLGGGLEWCGGDAQQDGGGRGLERGVGVRDPASCCALQNFGPQRVRSCPKPRISIFGTGDADASRAGNHRCYSSTSDSSLFYPSPT